MYSTYVKEKANVILFLLTQKITNHITNKSKLIVNLLMSNQLPHLSHKNHEASSFFAFLKQS
jgi:hypothetical protein